MSWIVLNDTHLGVKRTGGTTPASAAALREWQHTLLRDLMFLHADKSLIFNGDIFDRFDVELSVILDFYQLCVDWLHATRDTGNRLVLGRGNHDISRDSSKLSAFDFATRLIAAYAPERVQVVTEPAAITDSIFMIPHLHNQEVFNLALKDAEALTGQVILLHANYDNGFAEAQDHSLNVSAEQAIRLCASNVLLFGHEHVERSPNPGIIIPGNQIPTSVADCLGRQATHFVRICPSQELTQVPYLILSDGIFKQVDWRDLKDAPDAKFLRVGGEAEAAEAAEAIQSVAKLRGKHDSFVITNGVRIAGMDDEIDGGVLASLEAVQRFDVLSLLLEMLEPDQAAVVKQLMAEGDNDA